MRLTAVRPRCSSNSGRVVAAALPSPRALPAKKSTLLAAPRRAKNNERLSFHARSSIVVASASSSSSFSSDSAASSPSSGDDDEACEVYVTPDGEVVEVRENGEREKQKRERRGKHSFASFL